MKFQVINCLPGTLHRRVKVYIDKHPIKFKMTFDYTFSVKQIKQHIIIGNQFIIKSNHISFCLKNFLSRLKLISPIFSDPH